jgi:hypothetical protein
VRSVAGLHGGGREGTEHDFGDGVPWYVMALAVDLVMVVVSGVSSSLSGRP